MESGIKKGFRPNDRNPCYQMVGGIGLEPMTSSASRKRSSSELTTRHSTAVYRPLLLLSMSGAHLFLF